MNYLSHFGLREEPFAHAPSGEFYFASPLHTEALKRLTYAVESMKGLALLIGPVGCGKTTLARRLLDAMPDEQYEAAMLVIVHRAEGASWLLRRVASQLGVTHLADDNPTLLGQLFARLVQIQESGKRTVVLIDEAQMLHGREMMEELRGLLNLEVPGQRLITFVFFGLPELEEHVRLDPALAQRVAMRCQVRGMAPADTAAYIRFRLQQAGGNPELFEDLAILEVHAWTHGVPRLINTVCDNALLECFFAGAKTIDAHVVRQVGTNLGLTRAASSAMSVDAIAYRKTEAPVALAPPPVARPSMMEDPEPELEPPASDWPEQVDEPSDALDVDAAPLAANELDKMLENFEKT